jgi:predicted O-methyltransferase YrrM
METLGRGRSRTRAKVSRAMEKVTSDSADEVLGKIEQEATRHFLPIIGPEKGKILAETVNKYRPKEILEIGTLIGYSAILMAKKLSPDAHLTSIEIHSKEAKAARRNIAKADVHRSIDIIVGDALEVLPTLKGKLDMVFIDAEKTEYLRYLCLVEKRLHRGAVIVADNAGIFADQMKDYLDYVRNSGKYSSEYRPVENDGIEISLRL